MVIIWGEPGLPKAQVLCSLDKWLKHNVCNAYRRRGILVLTDLSRLEKYRMKKNNVTWFVDCLGIALQCTWCTFAVSAP